MIDRILALDELYGKHNPDLEKIQVAQDAKTREIMLEEVERFRTPAKLTIRLEKGDIVIAKEDFEALKKRR